MGSLVGIDSRSKYAPIRYEATRPFAQLLGKRFVAETSGKNLEQRAQFLKTEWSQLVREAITINARSSKYDFGPGPGQSEMVNLQIFGHYQDAGRVVFDVSKELSHSLLLTDAHDIPCNALDLPNEAFYIHFGHGSGLSDNGYEIEGVFVAKLAATETEPQLLTIDPVPVGHFAVQQFWQLPQGEPMPGVSVRLTDPNEPIMHALARSIDYIVAENEVTRIQFDALKQELSEKYGRPIEVPNPVHKLADKRELFTNLLQLTINTLFYLSAEPDDVHEGWDLSAPSDLLLQTHSEKPGTRRTAENTLRKQGYIKVRFVGKTYSETVKNNPSTVTGTSGKTLSPHFRRGHFRRQAYGPARASRKTIFVAPTLVNPGHGDMPGRIYEVVPPNQST